MTIKTVAVIGCGAVGLFYGCKLKRGGAEVKFLLRSDYDFVRQNGVLIRSIHGDFHEHVSACKNPAECRGADLIIVSLKTTASDYLLNVLPEVYSPGSYVLILQNGLGNEALVSSVVPKKNILGAVAFVCLNRESPGVVSHTAFGYVKAQCYGSKSNPRILSEVEKLFKNGGIEFYITDSLLSIKWEKLVWNVPFNGLSAALGGVDTETILRHPPTCRLVENLMQEVLRAARSQDISLNNKLIDENISRTMSMGKYLTSMCIDRRLGRPVEAESIIGEPLRLGNRGGLKLPYMENLYAALSYYNRYSIQT